MTPFHLQIQLQKNIIVVLNINCKVYFFLNTSICSFNSLNINVNIEDTYDILYSHCLTFLTQFENQSLLPSKLMNIKRETL